MKKKAQVKRARMKITIVYDNEVKKGALKADWGFSALIETGKASPILFDTGSSGSILIHNMKELGIEPGDIATIVISHAHGDHTGGIPDILKENENAELYIPSSFHTNVIGRKITAVKEAIEIAEDIFSTGELGNTEQS